eukprot:gene23345-biopygen11825
MRTQGDVPHNKPVLLMSPKQQLEGPPGRKLQPEPEHMPQLRAQQTLPAWMPGISPPPGSRHTELVGEEVDATETMIAKTSSRCHMVRRLPFPCHSCHVPPKIIGYRVVIRARLTLTVTFPATSEPVRALRAQKRSCLPLLRRQDGSFVTGSCQRAHSKTSNIHYHKSINIADRLWPRLSTWRGG